MKVGPVTESTAWLTSSRSRPSRRRRPRIASDIREHALSALGEAELLRLLELGPLARLEHPHIDVRRSLGDRDDELDAAGGRGSAGSPQAEVQRELRPQWIGIATLGPIRRTASAARRGSRWPPLPSVGPQPRIG